MGMTIEEFEEYAKSHNILIMTRELYENRLKADLEAILVELQVEIEESENCGKAFHLGLQMASNIIQQKINELKQESTTKNDLGVDCISRQEVLDLIADYDLSMGQVVRGIHALPPVTPQEPKTGYWIPTYGNVKCSVCGSVKDTRNVGRATHYCDFCGAKMESEG